MSDYDFTFLDTGALMVIIIFITSVSPLLIASLIFVNKSYNDKVFGIEIPNTHQYEEDWNTFFISDIKVIDSNELCESAESDFLFQYVW